MAYYSAQQLSSMSVSNLLIAAKDMDDSSIKNANAFVISKILGVLGSRGKLNILTLAQLRECTKKEVGLLEAEDIGKISSVVVLNELIKNGKMSDGQLKGLTKTQLNMKEVNIAYLISIKGLSQKQLGDLSDERFSSISIVGETRVWIMDYLGASASRLTDKQVQEILSLGFGDINGINRLSSLIKTKSRSTGNSILEGVLDKVVLSEAQLNKLGVQEVKSLGPKSLLKFVWLLSKEQLGQISQEQLGLVKTSKSQGRAVSTAGNFDIINGLVSKQGLTKAQVGYLSEEQIALINIGGASKVGKDIGSGSVTWLCAMLGEKVKYLSKEQVRVVVDVGFGDAQGLSRLSSMVPMLDYLNERQWEVLLSKDLNVVQSLGVEELKQLSQSSMLRLLKSGLKDLQIREWAKDQGQKNKIREGLSTLNISQVSLYTQARLELLDEVIYGDEAGNTIKKAKGLGLLNQRLETQGEIGRVGDVDVYEVELREKETYGIEVQSADGKRWAGLYDANDEWVEATSRSGNKQTYILNKTGKYYIKVRGTENAPGQYRLIGEVLDVASSKETSQELELGKTTEGNWNKASDSDWFGVNLEAEKFYKVHLESGDGTGQISIKDEQGREVSASQAVVDTKREGHEVSILVMKAGKYFVSVENDAIEKNQLPGIVSFRRVSSTLKEDDYQLSLNGGQEIKSLSVQEVSELSIKQVAALTPEQIKDLSQEQIKALSQAQVEALDINGIVKWKAQQIDAFINSGKNFSPEQAWAYLQKTCLLESSQVEDHNRYLKELTEDEKSQLELGSKSVQTLTEDQLTAPGTLKFLAGTSMQGGGLLINQLTTNQLTLNVLRGLCALFVRNKSGILGGRQISAAIGILTSKQLTVEVLQRLYHIEVIINNRSTRAIGHLTRDQLTTEVLEWLCPIVFKQENGFLEHAIIYVHSEQLTTEVLKRLSNIEVVDENGIATNAIGLLSPDQLLANNGAVLNQLRRMQYNDENALQQLTPRQLTPRVLSWLAEQVWQGFQLGVQSGLDLLTDDQLMGAFSALIPRVDNESSNDLISQYHMALIEVGRLINRIEENNPERAKRLQNRLVSEILPKGAGDGSHYPKKDDEEGAAGAAAVAVSSLSKSDLLMYIDFIVAMGCAGYITHEQYVGMNDTKGIWPFSTACNKLVDALHGEAFRSFLRQANIEVVQAFFSMYECSQLDSWGVLDLVVPKLSIDQIKGNLKKLVEMSMIQFLTGEQIAIILDLARKESISGIEDFILALDEKGQGDWVYQSYIKLPRGGGWFGSYDALIDLKLYGVMKVENMWAYTKQSLLYFTNTIQKIGDEIWRKSLSSFIENNALSIVWGLSSSSAVQLYKGMKNEDDCAEPDAIDYFDVPNRRPAAFVTYTTGQQLIVMSAAVEAFLPDGGKPLNMSQWWVSKNYSEVKEQSVIAMSGSYNLTEINLDVSSSVTVLIGRKEPKMHLWDEQSATSNNLTVINQTGGVAPNDERTSIISYYANDRSLANYLTWNWAETLTCTVDFDRDQVIIDDMYSNVTLINNASSSNLMLEVFDYYDKVVGDTLSVSVQRLIELAAANETSSTGVVPWGQSNDSHVKVISLADFR